MKKRAGKRKKKRPTPQRAPLMASPTPQPVPTLTREEVEALLAERHARLLAEVDQLIALALVPLRDALAEAVTYGDLVALQAAAGQVLCAEEGGPVIERDPFVLTARASIGPWESWVLRRGA